MLYCNRLLVFHHNGAVWEWDLDTFGVEALLNAFKQIRPQHKSIERGGCPGIGPEIDRRLSKSHHPHYYFGAAFLLVLVGSVIQEERVLFLFLPV